MSISYSPPATHPESGVGEAIAKSSTATSNWLRRAAFNSLGLARPLRRVRALVALFALAFVSYHCLFH